MDVNKMLVFLSIWVGNSLVFILFDKLFGQQVVLGNDRVIAPMAATIGGIILTGAFYLVQPALKKTGSKVKDKRLLLVFYLVANMAAIWAIKRLEVVTGVGVSNNFYVAGMAFIATGAQWAAANLIAPLFLQKKKS